MKYYSYKISITIRGPTELLCLQVLLKLLKCQCCCEILLQRILKSNILLDQSYSYVILKYVPWESPPLVKTPITSPAIAP